MEIKAAVRAFVVDNFYVADSSKLSDDVSLLLQGIVDSTGVLEVVIFLEQTYGIQVKDEDLIPENLDSIAKIGRFVERKLASASSA